MHIVALSGGSGCCDWIEQESPIGGPWAEFGPLVVLLGPPSSLSKNIFFKTVKTPGNQLLVIFI
jgi:hypothetical protein